MAVIGNRSFRLRMKVDSPDVKGFLVIVSALGKK